MKNKKNLRSRTKAVIWSGLIAGTVFLVLEMLMVPLFLGDPAWAPVRMIGAIALGKDVLPPPATFDPGIMLAALGVHYSLSIIYTFVLSYLVSGRKPLTSVLIGGAFGLGLYFINFYGFTSVFPWFAMARNWVSVFCHIVFGITAGMTYYYMSGTTVPVEGATLTKVSADVKKEVKMKKEEEEELVEA